MIIRFRLLTFGAEMKALGPLFSVVDAFSALLTLVVASFFTSVLGAAEVSGGLIV